MTSNNQTNEMIKWSIIFADFLLLNVLLFLSRHNFSELGIWREGFSATAFVLSCNFSLVVSELWFHPVIHNRLVSAGDILRRVVLLTITHFLVTYLLMKIVIWQVPVGGMLFFQDTVFFFLVLLSRLAERLSIKRLRELGRNTRSVTLVGNDPELLSLYHRLAGDPTTGYRFLGYYADADMGEWTFSQHSFSRENIEFKEKPESASAARASSPLQRLGTLQEFLDKMATAPEGLTLGDELYVSLSRRDRDVLHRISSFCDRHVIRFYYVPVSVESLGMRLKKEFVDDIEVFTTHKIPLSSPLNRYLKRLFDIVLSLVFLLPTAILFPFIYVIIKIQSPGPVFFSQKRTGLDGRDFEMLKFRSMHVNADADRLQATKDDPRKYPFGNFMRKSNIDELPQFLNVLRGDMSIVGPRPHMLAHTEQYSQMIDKYMVRHFVKPGLTGWAQVTGFRGETKELWQMEGRVKRDIWYIEHWSVWLDIRIIWLTAKTVFIHDKNAY